MFQQFEKMRLCGKLPAISVLPVSDESSSYISTDIDFVGVATPTVQENTAAVTASINGGGCAMAAGLVRPSVLG